MKDKIVPKLPRRQVVVPQKARRNLEGWIAYLKNISPRVKIVTSEDEKFFEHIKKIESLLKEAVGQGKEKESVNLQYFPKKESVVLIVSTNSSISPGKETQFLIKDSFLFCKHDKMFTLDPDSWMSDYENGNWDNYCYEPPAGESSWEEAVRLMKIDLESIEEKVPDVPKK